MKRLLVLPLSLLVAAKASACAACFGKTDAPLAQGMNAGIFAMLAFVVLAWVAFGSFFVFIARRAKRVKPEGETGENQD